MKKSLILVGMLSIGYAYAQSTDPYEGKVGINTDVPSATLNVKSKTGTTSATKNLELENANGIKMFTVLDNGRIGINSTNPDGVIEVVSNGARYSDNVINFKIHRDSGGGGIDTYRSRGSKDKPSAVTYDDSLSNFHSIGYTGTKYITTYRIGASVTGEVTSDKIETSFGFDYSNSGTNFNRAMTLYHNGNVGIGTYTPQEVFHVAIGNVKVNNLPHTDGNYTDKIVVVDNTGVLKSIDRSSITNNEVKPTSTEGTCTDANLGTIHFKERALNGQTVGTLGFCSKQDGKHIWVYISNGGNILQSAGTNKFGEGL